MADGFLDITGVFGNLASDAAFRDAVRGNVVRLFRDGAAATLHAHLAAC